MGGTRYYLKIKSFSNSNIKIWAITYGWALRCLQSIKTCLRVIHTGSSLHSSLWILMWSLLCSYKQGLISGTPETPVDLQGEIIRSKARWCAEKRKPEQSDVSLETTASSNTSYLWFPGVYETWTSLRSHFWQILEELQRNCAVVFFPIVTFKGLLLSGR